MEITNQDHNVDICRIGSDESGTGWNMITLAPCCISVQIDTVMDACQNRFIFFFSDDVGLSSPPYLCVPCLSVIHTYM